jgi:Ca2+-binding EF-hand superfamily protein
MLLKCGLAFEDSLLQRIMDKLDDNGTGEIDFRKFCEVLMGSGKRDSVGLKLQTELGTQISDDAGNSEMMIKRKVQMSFRDLRRAFKELDRGGNGVLSMEDFRFALQRLDIIMTEQQFIELSRKIDANGDGQISYAEFLEYFRKQDDQLGMTKVEGISVDSAISLLATKILEKLDSREGALRRAFQSFDADGEHVIHELGTAAVCIHYTVCR